MRVAITLLLLALLTPGAASAQVLDFVDQWPLGPPDEPNNGIDPFVNAELSPDGGHVYVVQSNTDTLRVFLRNAASGELAPIQTLAESDPGVRGLASPWDLSVSPDGQNVYVTSSGEDSVAWFLRDPNAGTLTYQDRIVNGTGALTWLDGPSGIDVSPDGQNVYVTAAVGNSLAVFDRSSSTGALSFVEEHFTGSDPNNPVTEGLRGAFDVDVHPDGIQVYVASVTSAALAIFQRAPAGSVVFIGGFRFAGLIGARAVRTSHDGETIYVVSEGFSPTFASTLSAFDQDDGGGTISFIDIETLGVDGVTGMSRAFSLAISPDDDFVYVGGNLSDSIALFERVQATGVVDFQGSIVDGLDGEGLDQVTGLAASPDSAHLYAVSRHAPAGSPGGGGDDGIALFEIDADEDGWPNADDNCRYEPNPGQEDSGGQVGGFGGGDGSPDGIGDACQCGDVSGNGVVDISDVVLYRRFLGGQPGPWSPERCSVVGPDGICDSSDVVIMRRTFGAQPPGIAQVCAAAVP